jgi:hypothetical protein
MSCQCSIHRCSYNSEIILFISHVLLQCLRSRFLFSCLWIYQVLLWLFHHHALSSCFGIDDGRIGAAFLFGETEVDEVNEMRLGGVVTNYNVGWFEVSMNIALRMYTVKSIHQVKGNNYHGLYLKLALLKRFFQFLEVHS